MIRILGKEEKVKTRTLYEESFPEDSTAFVDYYYSHKTQDNEIFVTEEDDRLCGMIHLNPYNGFLDGNSFPMSYIVAVATIPQVRKQGKMYALMTESLRYLRGKGDVLTYLMPANPDYYYSSGFQFLPDCDLAQEEMCLSFFSKLAERKGEDNLQESEISLTKYGFGKDMLYAAEVRLDVALRPLQDYEFAEAAVFANKILRQQYDFFLERDEYYYQRFSEEMKCQGGELLALWQGKRITGILSYGLEEKPDVPARESETDVAQKTKNEPKNEANPMAQQWNHSKVPKEQPLAILQIQDFICEDTEQLFSALANRFPNQTLNLPKFRYMVRILNLEKLGGILKSRSPIHFTCKVCDDIILENNGFFEITSRQGTVHITPIAPFTPNQAYEEIEIGELAARLFQGKKVFFREWV
ncbi:hypothetical protein FACS1894111_01360 [Clostridia bacterium]|nr:hypothetical protein FACS1894111_01360 [Clostridia bacterium]